MSNKILEAVITKGQLEDEVIVAGSKVIMHIAKVREEQAVNKSTENVNLLDRDYERWVYRLSWAVTRIDGHIFEDSKEATEFFRDLTQPHLEAYVKAYSDLFERVNKNLGTSAKEIKN